MSEILPVLQKIQAARRPLILFGMNKPEQLRNLMYGLAPEGLCLIPQADTVTQAEQLLAEIMGKRQGVLGQRQVTNKVEENHVEIL